MTGAVSGSPGGNVSEVLCCLAARSRALCALQPKIRGRRSVGSCRSGGLAKLREFGLQLRDAVLCVD